jgi:dATP pyrophosphohydrolase
MDTRYSIASYVFSFQGVDLRFLTLLRAPGHADSGTWQGVRGSIDAGEAAFQAAYRETVEESGLTPRRFFQVELIEHSYDLKRDALRVAPVFAAFVPGVPDARLSHEHAEFAWRSPDEARAAFASASQRQAVDIIERGVAGWPNTGAELFDITTCIAGAG